MDIISSIISNDTISVIAQALRFALDNAPNGLESRMLDEVISPFMKTFLM